MKSDIIEKRTNIPIFIPHSACPHKCAFCNQHIITGEKRTISVEKIREAIETWLAIPTAKTRKAEIAFFGGTFTALPESEMMEYLETAAEYIKEYSNILTGIRCSTRPDCIDGNVIEILNCYPVTAVELGAQSMDDDVLKLNNRGHTADDTRKAAELIKSAGIELGLQMMTGLYGDSTNKSLYTADEFVKLSPCTARIYPTVIMPNTDLARLYKNGEYTTFTLDETIQLAADIYEKFTSHDIRVIRIGLDTSPKIEREMLGGCYHPAMGELVISRYYLNKLMEFAKSCGNKNFTVYSDKKYFSKISGQTRSNIKQMERMGYSVKLKEKIGASPYVVGSGKDETCFLNP